MKVFYEMRDKKIRVKSPFDPYLTRFPIKKVKRRLDPTGPQSGRYWKNSVICPVVKESINEKKHGKADICEKCRKQGHTKPPSHNGNRKDNQAGFKQYGMNPSQPWRTHIYRPAQSDQGDIKNQIIDIIHAHGG